MEGTVLLCGPALPRPPRQHLLPKSLHHTQTVTPQERKTQEVGMAVSMDTISIVTMWGEGGGGDDGKGGCKGWDKNIYI